MEEIYIDGIHEYDYLKTKTEDSMIHTLYYSDHLEWTSSIVGTKAIELIDSGDGVQIKGLALDEEENYLKVEQLHIILRLYSQESTYEIAPAPSKREF
jgi:hypothetical protein